MNNNLTKKKLQLLSQPLVGQVIYDIMLCAERELVDEDIGTPEEYARAVKGLMEKQASVYKAQLKKPTSVKQLDLETAIENAYKEAEERFPQTLKQLGDE